jgi:hypothetical protein
MTILLVLFAGSSPAQSTANIRGKVVDQLGSRIPDAKVVLVENDKTIVEGQVRRADLSVWLRRRKAATSWR